MGENSNVYAVAIGCCNGRCIALRPEILLKGEIMRSYARVFRATFRPLICAILLSRCVGYDSGDSAETALALLVATANGDLVQADSIALATLTVVQPANAPKLAFALSVYAYLVGNDSLLEQKRTLAFPPGQSSQTTHEWIAEATTDSTFPLHFALFIQALATRAQGDTSAANGMLHDAMAAPGGDQWKGHYRNTLTAIVDSTTHISMGIRSDAPLTFSGNMRAFNGGWLPVEGEFQVDGGRMVSYFGSQNRKYAEFGGWRYARVSPSDSIIGWAATFTSGELYLAARPARTADSSDLLLVQIQSEYHVTPVDYWGKFKLVTLDPQAGHSFPLLRIPFYKAEDGSEISTNSLGTTFHVDPKHFVQGSGSIRFFGGSALLLVVSSEKVTGRVYQVEWF